MRDSFARDVAPGVLNFTFRYLTPSRPRGVHLAVTQTPGAQMPDTPQQSNSNPPDPKPKGTPRALKLSSRCPSCGRTGVVVFSIPPPADSPDETHRLVCLHCCPKPAGES
jgi:hypothetical protein